MVIPQSNGHYFDRIQGAITLAQLDYLIFQQPPCLANFCYLKTLTEAVKCRQDSRDNTLEVRN